MDKLDMEILQLLEKDASLPYTEIARRLKLNESTVRKRVAALKQKGVIRKFTVAIEPSKIGFNTVAIIGVDVDPPKLLEVAQKLCEIPETRYVATSTGDHMIMTEIWTRDGKELSKIISEKIGTIEGVKKICPAIILEKLKV
ncbi:Lrp/AsnC family transcriptional regulator [Candidatus Bathyarchaeota archaeon]|nr:MAG: Lrp/AsnC family transcriptional regulator [Candidatus Bathyarchaeota archaeon]RJS82235.1 MAG: Lrp/AsnC family transcriptional regulator [Candidatus Bathyarchaeota archaeon]HDD70409.1 Lrp/AsnC family transcriptional regulator [Candidatus Bathyarchaeota archaeon]